MGLEASRRGFKHNQGTEALSDVSKIIQSEIAKHMAIYFKKGNIPDGHLLEVVLNSVVLAKVLFCEGTYGKVCKAKEKSTGQVVALKETHLEMDEEGVLSMALREVWDGLIT
ncbi:cyclin-dependent kinase B1 [Perilla frutescens var. frutescens]|nr:cyclin-dependent kinase B1 [Perilla frutescens var. frutescens]